jgi:kinesin family protein C2/C3
MKKRKPLRLMQNNESTIIKDLVQIPVFDLKEAEDTIRFGFANRATSKTELNEASSRSHAVLCITLITFDEFEEEPTMSHMCKLTFSLSFFPLNKKIPFLFRLDICDLAGNEPSNSTGKQLVETCNINTSLMTFKDCIRVLNENQTAK